MMFLARLIGQVRDLIALVQMVRGQHGGLVLTVGGQGRDAVKREEVGGWDRLTLFVQGVAGISVEMGGRSVFIEFEGG